MAGMADLQFDALAPRPALLAQLVRAVLAVRECSAALTMLREVRRRALRRHNYRILTAPARNARIRAEREAAHARFRAQFPRPTARISTGGYAPTEQYREVNHSGPIRDAMHRLRNAKAYVVMIKNALRV